MSLVTLSLMRPGFARAQPSQQVLISWPASAGSFPVESARAIPGTWQPFTGTIVETNGRQGIRAELLRTERTGEAVFLDAVNLSPDSRDRGPCLSSDGLSLYFCTNISGNFDLWTTKRRSVNSPWEPPTPLDAINTEGDEVFPALSADGLSLYFSDAFFLPSARDGNLGSADLWVSLREDLNSPWKPAVHLGSAVNGPATDSGMTISADGKTIIFVSNRRGGLGGFDLWMTTRESVNNPQGWRSPVHLGVPVNSTEADSGPSLSRDGLSLFFSSGRPSPGRPPGLNNIWVARRRNLDEPFGDPMSLGPFFEEFEGMLDPHISADGRTLYFNSLGRLSNPAPVGDIWQVPIATTVEPSRYFILRSGYGEAAMLNAPAPVGSRASRDRGPSFSGDGLSLFFCSDVAGSMDLWVMTRSSPTEPWLDPVALDGINTGAHEAFPAASGDGMSLVFSDWFLFEENHRPDGFGNGDLWMSTRANGNGPWQSAVNLGPVVNSEYAEATPTLSGDGRTLIFASDRPGKVSGSGTGFRGLDLWLTTRVDSSDPSGWREPVHLGDVVNSRFADWSPSLSRDGLALYFSSDRPGLGRAGVPNNIWVARRESVTEPFRHPVSLEPHFLHLGNMLDPCIAPDDSILVFATIGRLDDPFPRGFVDLWQAPVVQPPPISISGIEKRIRP